MPQFVPIFPLNLVAFPTEKLNLHIFEPRYIELINDCIEQQRSFGIIPVINGELKDYGTLVSIAEKATEYEGGKMDIKTIGEQAFKVLEITHHIPDKLYAGAIVQLVDKIEIKVSERLSDLIKDEVIRLFKLLNDTAIEVAHITMDSSYDIAHKIGLSLMEEFELLQLESEIHRQEFIRRHLKRMEPTLIELEKLKEKIRLNGHFKNIKGANF